MSSSISEKRQFGSNNYKNNTNLSNDMHIINNENNTTNRNRGKNILPSGTKRGLHIGSKFLELENLISFLSQIFSQTSVNKEIEKISSTYGLSKIKNVQDILREYSLSILDYILSKDSNEITDKDIIVFNLCLEYYYHYILSKDSNEITEKDITVFNLCLDYSDDLIFEKTNSGKTPLIFACEQLNLVMVEKILDKIKNLPEKEIDEYIYQMDNDGNTAPMILFSYFLKYPRKKNKENKDLRNEILKLFNIDYSSNYISPNNIQNNTQEEGITGNSNNNNNNIDYSSNFISPNNKQKEGITGNNGNPRTKKPRLKKGYFNNMNTNLNRMNEVVTRLNGSLFP